MISAVCPLRYNPGRTYFGRTKPFLNIQLTIDCALMHKIIKQIIVVSHTPLYISPIDPQVDFLKRHYAEDQRVVIIDLRHGDFRFNQSWLLNIGICRATQPYFMRFDIDNILEPRFQETVIKMKKVIDAGGVLHQDLHGRYESFVDWTKFKYPHSFYEIMGRMETVRDYVDTSSIICLMALITTIKGYDERMQVYGSQDNDINARLSMAGCHHVRGLKVIHQPHTHKRKLMKRKEGGLVMLARGLFRYATENDIVVANNKEWGMLDRPMTRVSSAIMPLLRRLGKNYSDTCPLPPTMMR